MRRSASSNNSGQWNFPGGTIEANETPIVAAYKELSEECGINRLKLHERCHVHNSLGSFFYFEALYLNNKIILNEESDRYKWVTYDELKKYKLHKSIKAYYGMLDVPSVEVSYDYVGSGIERTTIMSDPSTFINYLFTGKELKVTAYGGKNLTLLFEYMAKFIKSKRNPNLYVTNALLPEKKRQFLLKWNKFCKKSKLNSNFTMKEMT
jgi:8-oxo-dGTP diphosphatase